MALVAVWVDQNHANVYRFTVGGVQKKKYVGDAPDHHTHKSNHVDEQKHETVIFKSLLPDIRDADQILILGPGITKTHFKKFLEEDRMIAKKIVGCETTDHPTESQLVAIASKFFNEEHLK